jgi:hypothetical protein
MLIRIEIIIKTQLSRMIKILFLAKKILYKKIKFLMKYSVQIPQFKLMIILTAHKIVYKIK